MSYLDEITELSIQAQEVISRLAVIQAERSVAGEGSPKLRDQILRFTQLLSQSLNTSLSEEDRLKLLTRLVNDARLAEVPYYPYPPIEVTVVPTQNYVGDHNSLSNIQGDGFFHISAAQRSRLLSALQPADLTFVGLQGLPGDNVALAAVLDGKEPVISPSGNPAQFLNGNKVFAAVLYSQLGGKPTTLAGFGISASDTLFDGKYLQLGSLLIGISTVTGTQLDASTTVIQALGRLQNQVNTKEPALGNPSVNGYVLASLTNGTRYWIPVGGVYIEEGTNVTITGSGTESDPYIINASGGGGLTYPINATGAINEAQTTLASAATVNIGAAAANSILITGTTNISAFDSIQAGTVRTLIFTGSNLTLVHSSDLQLPNNADFIAYEGYAMEFTSLGAGAWKCTGIQFNYIPQNIASKQDVVLPSWPGDLGYPSTSALVAYSGTEITMADLITLRDAAGLAKNQRFIITDSTPSYLMVMAIGPSNLSPTAIRYFDSDTASFGTYNLDTDTFTPYRFDSYLTLDKTAWDALVAANGLVAGWTYKITGAYSNSAYGTMTALVMATGANTINLEIIQVIDEAASLTWYLPAKTDDIAFSTVQIVGGAVKLTSAQAVSLSSGFLGGLPIYIEFGGDQYYTNVLSGADAVASGCYKVSGSNNLQPTLFGILNSTFDAFTPIANVFSFDVTLTDTAAIQAMNSAPIEFVPDDGTLIQLTSCSMEVNADGTTDYDFGAYVSILSGTGSVLAMSVGCTVGGGLGLLDMTQIAGADQPGSLNLTLVNRATTTSNTGGLFFSAFTDATQGDRTIRLYGTYTKFAI